MPHLQIDYSANLESRLDVAGLCLVLLDAAAATGILPLARIRVRAQKAEHDVIANCNPDHAFLDISVRLRGGRTAEAKPKATESTFAAAEACCAVFIGKRSRRIPQTQALSHIAALTLSNEGTVRDRVRHAKLNVTQGKNRDRSCAMGPGLVPFTDHAQITDVALSTRVNGEVRQQDRTSRMLFPVARQIPCISTFTSLAVHGRRLHRRLPVCRCTLRGGRAQCPGVFRPAAGAAVHQELALHRSTSCPPRDRGEE